MSSRGSHEVHSDEEDGSKSQELHLQPAFRSGSSMQLTVQRNLHNPTDDAEASEEEGDWKENELGQIENCCKKNIKKKELRGTVLSDHRINVEDHHLTVASDYAEGQPADSKSWNQDRNSKKKTPCSSGEFTFKGFRKKKAKYVRTSNNTSPEVLYEMMIDQFQLRVPNLLISVTGGARNFSMNPRLRDLFGKGLVKAAQSTEAWIITGGCHAGVMKLVGEAVQDFSMTSSSYKIVTIGIATWGIVYNSARMVRKAGVLPAEYSLDVENIDGLPCLDNNHSHFILVDDGTLGSCGGEIPLRTDLERFISEQTVKGEGFQRLRSSRPGHVRASRKERKSRGDGMKIPIMCLVLEGDPDSLDTIHRSMINNTPCVIVEGSGGVADVIAQVADMNPSKITIALIKEKLSHFSQETIGEKQIIEWTKKIQDIVRMSRLLTIFRYDKDGAQDMDVAMLHALMKASQSMDHMGNENWAYQLKLAVLWNHMDIAKSDIFNSAWSWKPEDLYPALTVALIENRPNFVQLFLDQGVSLQDYVTEKTLIQLYNNIETTFVFHQKLEKIMFKQTKKHKNENEEGVNLDHIEKALKSMLGKFPKLVDSTPEPTAPQTAVNIQSQGIHDTNGQRPSKVKYPIRVLLIWAVMQNRGKLAEILWTQCQDCIVGALACSKILRTLSKEEKDTNNKTAMKALADRFEERASGVFSECYKQNKVRAEQLLTRKSLGWGDTTCMQLATNAKAMSFMSNGGVQAFLTKIWWGKLSVDNSLKRLLFCMVFFPLISTGFITFRSKKSGTRSTWQHLCAFVTAPVVIFYYNVASYIGFLWLFAYVLMMDFQNNPSRNEYLLYIWSFSLVCEEVRQVLYDHEDMRFVTKVRMYITEFWNQMDVVAIGLFIAGLAVRCIAHSPYVGRVILAVDFIVFCLRLMHIFTLSKVLGPKIIMMQRMTMDIFFFLFLLAVWIVSFGVSKQAILVHNEQRLDWIFRSVIYQPYLILFGQLPTDVDKTHFLNDTECTSDGSDADKPKCAEILDGYLMFPGGLTIVLQCLYLLFANILLLNLLIAMFSHTFSKVQENTDQIWKFQRYKLIKEYSNRPPAPPPFILLNLLMSLATKVVRVVSRKLDHDEKRCKHELDDYETRGLLSWEKYMKEDYLLNQREVQNQSSDMKTRATSKKVDALAKLLESEQKRARAMEQQVFLSLSWIMKSLTEKGSASEEKAPVMVHQKSIEAEEPTTGDSLMSSKCEYHVNSRQLMYPNSNVQRFPVPDELVPWQVDFPLYDPPSYVAKIERQETYNPWIESTGFQPKREYTEKDRLLLNPEGRTGIKGLGSQMWYGPNHCLHPVLTRWKRTDNGSFVWKDKKKVLEVLAVKREGSERWVLPGGRLRPDEKLPSTLKDILKEEFWETFEALLENGTEVYKGYLDDPRNTDNAWVEIHTVNVHLESPEDLDLLELNLHILESADSIRWQMVDEKILLYANMKDILQQVARKLDAHY